jgi:hypothetical protein
VSLRDLAGVSVPARLVQGGFINGKAAVEEGLGTREEATTRMMRM